MSEAILAADTDIVAGRAREMPLLRVRELTKAFGRIVACRDISLDVWPSEVIAVVGESGSGKTTLLNCLSGRLRPDAGSVGYRALGARTVVDVLHLDEAKRRSLARTEWGFVHQNARDGLRMTVTAGGNIGERMLACGVRHYGRIRAAALEWLDRVEIDRRRIDELPVTFSGGMQQRLQVARTLVSKPRLVFLDEPTGGLDVSVQARLLDLLRRLVQDIALSAVVVTHDLAVARLLANRIIVMQGGKVVETGLTDQVLDDPQDPYTQLMVSSVLQI